MQRTTWRSSVANGLAGTLIALGGAAAYYAYSRHGKNKHTSKNTEGKRRTRRTPPEVPLKKQLTEALERVLAVANAKGDLSSQEATQCLRWVRLMHPSEYPGQTRLMAARLLYLEQLFRTMQGAPEALNIHEDWTQMWRLLTKMKPEYKAIEEENEDSLWFQSYVAQKLEDPNKVYRVYQHMLKLKAKGQLSKPLQECFFSQLPILGRWKEFREEAKAIPDSESTLVRYHDEALERFQRNPNDVLVPDYFLLREMAQAKGPCAVAETPLTDVAYTTYHMLALKMTTRSIEHADKTQSEELIRKHREKEKNEYVPVPGEFPIRRQGMIGQMSGIMPTQLPVFGVMTDTQLWFAQFVKTANEHLMQKEEYKLERVEVNGQDEIWTGTAKWTRAPRSNDSQAEAKTRASSEEPSHSRLSSLELVYDVSMKLRCISQTRFKPENLPLPPDAPAQQLVTSSAKAAQGPSAA